MDCWDPETFDAELIHILKQKSDLFLIYYQEDRRLMDDHVNSDPYESIKPNKYFSEFQHFKECVLAPLMAQRRIRVWHYTRITDDETKSMQARLVPSSLAGLRERLANLYQQGLLTEAEVDIIYRESPYQKQGGRFGQICSVDIPLTADYDGVEPLLGSWGGESAYFWLSDKNLCQKLKNIGKPRIVEIETSVNERLNNYTVSETVIEAWARKLGAQIYPTGHDLFIRECIDGARVLRILTEGDGFFEEVGRSYPVQCDTLISK